MEPISDRKDQTDDLVVERDDVKVLDPDGVDVDQVPSEAKALPIVEEKAVPVIPNAGDMISPIRSVSEWMSGSTPTETPIPSSMSWKVRKVAKRNVPGDPSSMSQKVATVCIEAVPKLSITPCDDAASAEASKLALAFKFMGMMYPLFGLKRVNNSIDGQLSEDQISWGHQPLDMMKIYDVVRDMPEALNFRDGVLSQATIGAKPVVQPNRTLLNSKRRATVYGMFDHEREAIEFYNAEIEAVVQGTHALYGGAAAGAHAAARSRLQYANEYLKPHSDDILVPFRLGQKYRDLEDGVSFFYEVVPPVEVLNDALQNKYVRDHYGGILKTSIRAAVSKFEEAEVTSMVDRVKQTMGVSNNVPISAWSKFFQSTASSSLVKRMIESGVMLDHQHRVTLPIESSDKDAFSPILPLALGSLVLPKEMFHPNTWREIILLRLWHANLNYKVRNTTVGALAGIPNGETWTQFSQHTWAEIRQWQMNTNNNSLQDPIMEALFLLFCDAAGDTAQGFVRYRTVDNFGAIPDLEPIYRHGDNQHWCHQYLAAFTDSDMTMNHIPAAVDGTPLKTVFMDGVGYLNRRAMDYGVQLSKLYGDGRRANTLILRLFEVMRSAAPETIRVYGKVNGILRSYGYAPYDVHIDTVADWIQLGESRTSLLNETSVSPHEIATFAIAPANIVDVNINPDLYKIHWGLCEGFEVLKQCEDFLRDRMANVRLFEGKKFSPRQMLKLLRNMLDDTLSGSSFLRKGAELPFKTARHLLDLIMGPNGTTVGSIPARTVVSRVPLAVRSATFGEVFAARLRHIEDLVDSPEFLEHYGAIHDVCLNAPMLVQATEMYDILPYAVPPNNQIGPDNHTNLNPDHPEGLRRQILMNVPQVLSFPVRVTCDQGGMFFVVSKEKRKHTDHYRTNVPLELDIVEGGSEFMDVRVDYPFARGVSFKPVQLFEVDRDAQSDRWFHNMTITAQVELGGRPSVLPTEPLVGKSIIENVQDYVNGAVGVGLPPTYINQDSVVQQVFAFDEVDIMHIDSILSDGGNIL